VNKFAAIARHRPLALSPGYPPWHPCPGCVRLRVFGYDRGAPVDGIFLYGEHQQYLFSRVGFDVLGGTGKYAYVSLSRRILGRLQNAGDSYAGLRQRCLARGRVVYAAVAGIGDAQRIIGQADPP
jgi:hypothetical protein